jgi:hypothetical protein
MFGVARALEVRQRQPVGARRGWRAPRKCHHSVNKTTTLLTHFCFVELQVPSLKSENLSNNGECSTSF